MIIILFDTHTDPTSINLALSLLQRRLAHIYCHEYNQKTSLSDMIDIIRTPKETHEQMQLLTQNGKTLQILSSYEQHLFLFVRPLYESYCAQLDLLTYLARHDDLSYRGIDDDLPKYLREQCHTKDTLQELISMNSRREKIMAKNYISNAHAPNHTVGVIGVGHSAGLQTELRKLSSVTPILFLLPYKVATDVQAHLDQLNSTRHLATANFPLGAHPMRLEDFPIGKMTDIIQTLVDLQSKFNLSQHDLDQLAYALITAKTNDPNLALRKMAFGGDCSHVKVLLKCGADPNTTTSKGENALDLSKASAFEPHEKIALLARLIETTKTKLADSTQEEAYSKPGPFQAVAHDRRSPTPETVKIFD